jgi:hypothetical protein
MKIEINKKLKSFDASGELKSAQGKTITLFDVCIASLLSPNQDDNEKDKWAKYGIYKKLMDAKEGIVDVTVEDISLLKNQIGKNEPPLVMGQCWEMLEGE